MSIEEKLSTLTTVPEKTYKDLENVLNAIYSHDICTQKLENKNIFELELFEGTLVLELMDDSVRFKFLPNKTFSKTIKDAIINNKSFLIDISLNKLKKSLENTYKDIY